MSGYITPPSASEPRKEVSPASKAATTSFVFAMIMLVADPMLTMIAGSVLSANDSVALAWTMMIIQAAVTLALFGLALTYGIIGLRETQGGGVRGTGLAVAGIVVAVVLLAIAAFWLPGEVEVAYLG